MDLPGEQIQFLLRVFMECPYPDEFQRVAIARDLGLHPQQIRYWFMNHRARMGLEEEEDVYYNYSRSRDVYYSEDVVDYSKDKDKNSKDKDDDSKEKDDEKKKKDDDKIH